MLILTLETTCDETAAAVVRDDLAVLSAVVASQQREHDPFGGVVPEIASRAHLERIVPVVDQALRDANVTLADLSAIAVATTPGLAGSLLVGLSAAKALAIAGDLPLVAINHLQGHIYAGRMAAGRDIFPCVGMVVSGGHSHLYRCLGPTDFELLGGTIDDAAGEAFDKVASLMGLPYPGGPKLAELAELGDARQAPLPRPLLDDPTRLEFSFSGLKTAVRYQLFGPGKLTGAAPAVSRQELANLAAGFQEAVVDCLVGKAELAIRKSGLGCLCIGGGVAANERLQQRFAASAKQHGYDLILPPRELCTDNAVMGAIAFERLKRGLVEALDVDIAPGLMR